MIQTRPDELIRSFREQWEGAFPQCPLLEIEITVKDAAPSSGDPLARMLMMTVRANHEAIASVPNDAREVVHGWGYNSVRIVPRMYLVQILKGIKWRPYMKAFDHRMKLRRASLVLEGKDISNLKNTETEQWMKYPLHRKY